MTRPLALITGPTAGIGFHTAIGLATRGFDPVLACRDPGRAAFVVDAVRAAAPESAPRLVALDLGSLRSVRACADQVLAFERPIHVLVNNAGLAGREPKLTEDGFDETFGVNHLGHYLFTRLLIPSLKRSGPGARVVHVSSRAHLRSRGIRWDAVRKTRGTFAFFGPYQDSKLANVLFAFALARRFDSNELASFALHPGVVATSIWRGLPKPIGALVMKFMITSEQGAHTSIFCATDPSLRGRTGLYFIHDSKEAPPNAVALDEGAQEDCWRRSAALVGLEP